MKERYEGRIKELMQEKAANAATSQQSNVIDEVCVRGDLAMES